LLTATTRNSYSFPSDKPPQAPVFCRPSISAPYEKDLLLKLFDEKNEILFAIDHVLFLFVQ
jgi:hypothetical protein